jgi:hypothetical protein
LSADGFDDDLVVPANDCTVAEDVYSLVDANSDFRRIVRGGESMNIY